jgi:pectin methylesterase-like acyl-CoA thioesterase
LYDFDGLPNGAYTDVEITSDINAISGKKFAFFDNCFSGGILDNLAALQNVIATSTCKNNGYGWDMDNFRNGAWTYVFLKVILITKYLEQPVDLQTAINDGITQFPIVTNKISPNDQPQFIDTLLSPFII